MNETYITISHSEWSDGIIAAHDIENPFAPENSQPLKFQIGDKVIFKNDYGVEFPYLITGFYKPKKPCSLYAVGYRYLVNSDSPWFPIKEIELRAA